ncbi:MAG: citrate synthase/methylcitrate synthase [Anaerolineaceae bacterium]|nr:citrate synthase/methylcitrate synthase [Anaerolineaceae bacterium]
MTAPLDIIMRPGLEGVIASETRLSKPNGQVGELFIAGFRLEDIAPYATFEEMLYLLWNDALPTSAQLAEFSEALASKRQLPPIAYDILQSAADKTLPVMDALRMAAGVLNLLVDADDARASAQVAVAAFPTIVAAYWRLLNGQEPLAPRTDLSHAANYLYMLDGETPSAERVRALETYLNTVVDHGFNASTFTSRIIASTQSDVIAAVVGAIGALKGPLHGGAPGPALDMVFEIGTPERAESVIRAKMERGERLMGFGHRVYKVRDPRADVLNSAAEAFFVGDRAEFYQLVRHVEQVALDLLEEYKPGRKLQTNVEFYTALVLHGIGLPSDLFSPTFAVSRVGGWTAHVLEHMQSGRIIRPLAQYTGPTDRAWVPLEKR